jgi:hypothetical protein
VAARAGDAVEQRLHAPRREDGLLAAERHHEVAARARRRGQARHLLALLGGGAVARRGAEPGEDARRADDRRLRRVGHRDLDDLDAEERRVGVLVGRGAHAPRELLGRAHAREPEM